MTKHNPCPICEKPDWCLIAPNGTACICTRIESEKKCGDAGWLHRLVDRPSSERKSSKGSKNDWAAEAARFAAALTPESKSRLACQLCLPVPALDRLPGLGQNLHDPAGECFTFPEVNATGTVVGINRRFGNGGKKAMSGGKRGLSLPDNWANVPGPAFVVEGPTDAVALAYAGACAVGRPSNAGGTKHLIALFRDWPADRPIVIVGENDAKPDGNWPGRRGAERVARELASALKRPVNWALPPAGTKDVRDWLTHEDRGSTDWQERGRELAKQLVDAATSVDPTSTGSGRPSIAVGTDEYRVNAEAASALALEPDVYQRGGLLVHVLEQDRESTPSADVRRPVGAPAVRELARPLLRERLTRCADWVQLKTGKDGDVEEVPCHPPEWCVGAIHARGNWPGVRRLATIATSPLFLSDGRILANNGYDPSSGILLQLPSDLAVDVPLHPSMAEVTAAVKTLLDPISDFPFQSEVHKSAFVAGLLTPLAWYAFQGPAPLFLIDKNVRGAGAGLLADVVALISTGRRFPVMSYTQDRDELRKRITTLAIEGERLVLLDNLAGAVGNDVLDAALTADTWKDRVLGGNRGYDGPLHVVWFGTGNNVQLQADTSRRICHIRMETADERPETRSSFRYHDLRDHVLRNRGKLLSAALTILRGWYAAGRPTHGLTPWGSYEGWSGVVREALVFAGMTDPGETRIALQSEADRDAGSMLFVIAGLAEMDPVRRGLTTGEIVERIKTCQSPPEWMGEMKSAIEELCGKLDSRLLGYRFRHFKRRNFSGRMLDTVGRTGEKTNRWTVISATAVRSELCPSSPVPSTRIPGDAGDEGDVLAGIGTDFAVEPLCVEVFE